MGLIEYYLIFALATGIACWYEFYWPVMQEARTAGVINVVTSNPLLSSVVYIVMSTIIAPVLIIPFLSTRKSELFKEGLRKSIFEED